MSRLKNLSRRHFLAGTTAAAALGPNVARSAQLGGHPDYLVFVMAQGGWDPSYSFDNKLDYAEIDGPTPSDDEYRHTFNDNQVIQCNDVTRPSVTEFFESWGHRTAVLNGLWTGSITHEPCRIRVLTGTTTSLSPDIPTIFGFEKSGAEPLGSIDLSGLSYPGDLAATTGRVGTRNQLRALLNPDSSFDPPSGADYTLPLFEPGTEDQARIRAVLEARAHRFAEAVTDAGGANDARMQDLLVSLRRREQLFENGVDLTESLPFGAESLKLENQTSTAVSLIEKGLCRAVTIRDSANWDTHRNNSSQHGLYNSFFKVMSTLLADLEDAGLLDRTLVVISSEMGRTPKLNGGAGKDHWGHTSVLLAGAGVAGGRTYGGTDDLFESQRVDYGTGDVFEQGELLKYDNFAAMVLAHMDVDPQRWLPGIPAFTAASELLG